MKTQLIDSTPSQDQLMKAVAQLAFRQVMFLLSTIFWARREPDSPSPIRVLKFLAGELLSFDLEKYTPIPTSIRGVVGSDKWSAEVETNFPQTATSLTLIAHMKCSEVDLRDAQSAMEPPALQINCQAITVKYRGHEITLLEGELEQAIYALAKARRIPDDLKGKIADLICQ